MPSFRFEVEAMQKSKPVAAGVWRGLLPLLGALLPAARATPQMEAQWRDAQFGARSMQGRAVLIRQGVDVTLERICEDRLAADAQAIGVAVVRSGLRRDAAAAPPGSTDALLTAARAARADAVLAMWLERSFAPVPLSGGSVGVGIGGGSGGWGSRIGGAVGITLPIGGTGPALASGASLTEAATGRLIWSGRARGSGAPKNEAQQVDELSRLITDALKGAGLF
ncbi:MAG: hypothetical protein MZW92_81890 [Comamonadaceae bacterium]|nr:hypothetical protein [Comamonadaceae bacterium]